MLEDSLERPRGFKLGVRCDDGAVVYLNGKEVGRVRMPDGPVTHETLATTKADNIKEHLLHTFELDPALIRVEAENVIAVEVHQVDPTSSDTRFDLRLTSSSTLLIP